MNKAHAADGRTLEAANTPAVAEQTALRVEHLPKEPGWLQITAGVIGLVVPGVLGTPFLLAGAVVPTPGGSPLLAHWSRHNPPRSVRTAMRQIGRFLGDLERRYPRR